MKDFRSKGPELLVDLQVHISSALKELAALEDGKALQVASEVTDRMTAHWGGQNIYFPIGKSVSLGVRDHKIYEEFNGSNHRELALKYGASLQWIYKIVKAMQKEKTDKRKKDFTPENISDPKTDVPKPDS